MPRYPRASEPRPAALPPETRTVGQLVAETLRLYGRRFLPALGLGLPVALLNQAFLARVDPAEVASEAGRVVTGDLWFLLALYVAAAPVLAAAYAWACRLAHEERPPPRAWAAAVVAGTLAFLPAALLLPTVFFFAVAWLALVGLVVPVCLLERTGVRAGFRRAVALGRADYVHAFAGLATLAIVYWLTRTALVLLLREQADNTIRTAAFLGDLVLSPILFLGPALLYSDQAARRRVRAEQGK
jgi:hypothetical protein